MSHPQIKYPASIYFTTVCLLMFDALEQKMWLGNLYKFAETYGTSMDFVGRGCTQRVDRGEAELSPDSSLSDLIVSLRLFHCGRVALVVQ